MGTIAVVEEQEGDWYRYLTSDLRLPSTIPVIRMLIQQSPQAPGPPHPPRRPGSSRSTAPNWR